MRDSKRQNWVKRHKVLTGVIALFVLIGVIGSIASSKDPSQSSSATTSSNSSNAAAANSKIPKVNQQANDGKLGFTVTSFRCGIGEISQPDNTDYTDTAGAPYCQMDVSIKGIDDVSQTFDSESQYVLDASGKQYTSDSTATIAANNSNSNCMLNPTVNPGVTLTCALIFDVPAKSNPTVAVLHDSAASGGVKVSLVQ